MNILLHFSKVIPYSECGRRLLGRTLLIHSVEKDCLPVAPRRNSATATPIKAERTMCSLTYQLINEHVKCRMVFCRLFFVIHTLFRLHRRLPLLSLRSRGLGGVLHQAVLFKYLTKTKGSVSQEPAKGNEAYLKRCFYPRTVESH